MHEIVLISPKSSDQAPTTPLWCKADLMNAAAAFNGLEPKLANVYKGEELVAQMPLYEKKHLGFVRLVPALGAYYQGVHFNHPFGTSPARNALDELRICSDLALFLKKHYKRFSVTLAPHNYDVRGFIWNKIKAQPFYTYIHDYGVDTEPLGKERRKLRNASKEGYTFEEFLDVSAYIELTKAMVGRKGMQPVKDDDKIKNFIEDLAKSGLLRQHNVCRDGKIVSINIMLQGDAEIAYSLFRSTAEEELSKGVSLWHTHMLIETLKSRCKVLDLCGANVPDVARFKGAMGHQLQLFFRISS